MQFVKPVNDQSWKVLNQIRPGQADYLMHQTPSDRMEAIATYLAEQIKVKIKSLFEIGFPHISKKYSLTPSFYFIILKHLYFINRSFIDQLSN